MYTNTEITEAILSLLSVNYYSLRSNEDSSQRFVQRRNAFSLMNKKIFIFLISLLLLKTTNDNDDNIQIYFAYLNTIIKLQFN